MLRRFLHSDGFRAPQFAAAALLLVYLLQCVWLVRVQTRHAAAPDSDQDLRTYQGLEQWKGGPIAGTPQPLGCLLPGVLGISACVTVTIRTVRLFTTLSPQRHFCCAPVRGCRKHSNRS